MEQVSQSHSNDSDLFEQRGVAMKKITWEDIKEVANNVKLPHHPPKIQQHNVPVRVVEPKVFTPATPPKPINKQPLAQDPTTMNSDSYFVIGARHDVCQDYATNHNNGLKSYVVLADGCSGSAESDIGARVLVKTHELYIPRVGVMDFNEYARRATGIYSQIIEEATENAKALDLDPMALDATIMSIVSNKNGEFMASCYGDGVVALGRRDGIIETYSVSYKQGYPNYLSYQFSKDRKQLFDEKTENYKEIVLEMIDVDGEPLKQKYRSSAVFDIYLGSKSKYLWVAVLSDGVNTFKEKVSDGTSITEEDVPQHKVIRELLNFKNYQGKFVMRRMKRFLESCAERKWTHHDDLSVGVVYLGND